MNVFIANVGNRDIALGVANTAFVMFSKTSDGVDGEYGVPRNDLPEALQGEEGTRYLSKRVRENLNDYDLRFPIIGPALEAVLGRVDVDRVDRIVLFATDQLETTPRFHRMWDTIESAHVLEELIQKRFDGQVGNIDVIPVTFNPSQHEPAHKFIGEEFANIKIDEQTQVFASIKGGTPAMNAALRERAIQYFGVRAWLVETDEPAPNKRWDGEEGGAHILSSWPFRKQNVLRLLEGFLNRHDYSAALQLLDAEAVDSTRAKVYLEHALARTNLDFAGAVNCLEEADRRNTLPDFTNSWKNSAKDKWGLQRLDDLAYSAQIALERHDYVGFLYRVTMFSESCLRLLCWIVADIRVTSGWIKPGDVKNEDLRERLNDDSDLTRKHWKKDKQAWEVNHGSLKRIIEIAAQCSTKPIKSVEETLSRLDGFDRLKDLRNGLAHSNKGASLPEIRDRFDIKNQAVKRAIEGIEDGETEFCPSATFGTLTKLRPLTEKIVKEIRYIWIITRYELPQPIIPVYNEINEAVLKLVENWNPNP